MKKVLGFALIGAFLLIQATGALAETKVYNLEVEIPQASSVGINAYQIVGKNDPVLVSGTNLNFGTLTLDPQHSVYRSDRFFYVEVVPQGAGDITTNVSYVEGQLPSLATRGLGTAATVDFAKAVPNSTDETPIGTKTKLSGLTRTISPTDVQGGWLKVYLGLATGEEQIPGLSIFTPEDQPGRYTGTVVFSVTIG